MPSTGRGGGVHATASASGPDFPARSAVIPLSSSSTIVPAMTQPAVAYGPWNSSAVADTYARVIQIFRGGEKPMTIPSQFPFAALPPELQSMVVGHAINRNESELVEARLLRHGMPLEREREANLARARVLATLSRTSRQLSWHCQTWRQLMPEIARAASNERVLRLATHVEYKTEEQYRSACAENFSKESHIGIDCEEFVDQPEINDDNAAADRQDKLKAALAALTDRVGREEIPLCSVELRVTSNQLVLVDELLETIRAVNESLPEEKRISVELHVTHTRDHGELPALTKYPELVSLDTHSAEDMPDLSGCPNLRYLDVFNCTGLSEKPDFSPNKKLVSVRLLECNSLREAPDPTCLPALTDFSINGRRITKAPDVSQCPELRRLSLTGTGISEPPDVSQNLKLTYLDLARCENLTSAPGVSKLKRLAKLNLSGSTNKIAKKELAALHDLLGEKLEGWPLLFR